MTVWDAYPNDYRSSEMLAIQAATSAGECVSIVGLSGSGKSNLAGFLTHRCHHEAVEYLLVDGNRAQPCNTEGWMALIGRSLDQAKIAPSEPNQGKAIEQAIEAHLVKNDRGLCLVLDRYDALEGQEQNAVSGELRALRDLFKYQLTYVTATRRPLDPASELAELFYAHTLWLKPLSASDALWTAGYFAARRRLAWDKTELQALAAVSWGYPSILRGCCEAYAQGCTLDPDSLMAHPSVQQRVEEFWADHPTPEMLRLSGLEGHPLLGGHKPIPTPAPADGLDIELTALEHRLLTFLQAHPGQICTKDDLIHAVWPEDRVISGLRDDSLAQLVRRLRQKIEPDPSNPSHILTVPGRGYRYTA